MALSDAMNLAQRYQLQGLDLQPMQAPGAPPLFNFQPPPMMQKPQNNGLGDLIGQGTQMLGGYLNKKRMAGANQGAAPMGHEAAGAMAGEHSMPAFELGGNWSRFLGMPVEVGEDGPEQVIGQNGQTQTVGQQGPQVVVPQQPATVIPNPSTETRERVVRPNTPADAGITDDTSQVRPRIANQPDFLRSKIADELGPVQGPKWGSGNVGLDADGNAIKAPGRGHAALAGLRAGAEQGMRATGDWRGAIAGALSGALMSGIKPEFGQEMEQHQQAQQDQTRLNQISQNQQQALGEGLKQAQIASQYGNIGYKQGQLGVAQQNADTRNTAVTNRKAIEDAKIKEGYDKFNYAQKRDLRNQIIREFNGLSEFDPDDPKNAKMVAAMESAGVPVTPKEPKRNVQMTIDQGTGEIKLVNKNTGDVSNAQQNGENATVTAPHMLRLDEIEKRAEAAAANAKSKEERKTLANQSRAKSWEDAAKEYDRQAKEQTDSGSFKAANVTKAKAIAARQKAASYVTQ